MVYGETVVVPIPIHRCGVVSFLYSHLRFLLYHVLSSTEKYNNITLFVNLPGKITVMEHRLHR